MTKIQRISFLEDVFGVVDDPGGRRICRVRGRWGARRIVMMKNIMRRRGRLCGLGGKRMCEVR